MKARAMPWLLGLAALFHAVGARADLYDAAHAQQRKDYSRAFELYRELAELGHPEAQENLAVLYVYGEGTARDNVLGYAWAELARANGTRGAAAQAIIEQLRPHLNDAARSTISDLHARFGPKALAERLIPVPMSPDATRPEGETEGCRMTFAPDPDKFYPPEAKRMGAWGSVLVEVMVSPSGSAHRANIWYGFPQHTFDEPARAVALASKFAPKVENGARVACALRFRVNFRIQGAGPSDAAAKEILAEARSKALAGDPLSQLTYGLLLATRPELDAEGEMPVRWFMRAAQAGLPVAQYLVSRHALSGLVFQADEAKATIWLQMAARAGSVDAMFALGSHLLRSSHDLATRMKGFEWMEHAAQANHREARFYLAGLLVAGPDPEKRDPARAVRLLNSVRFFFEYDPLSYEIRAAARALSGDFKDAVKHQKEAMRVAKRLGWDASLHEQRLEAYSQGRAWDRELIEF